VEHLSRERLMAGLGRIRDSPTDGGRVVLVVRRPAVGERDLPAEAVLDRTVGLAGDNWLARGSRSMPDGSADPQRQVTVMNARAAELVAGGADRMSLAGDQLYLDLDLSVENLPAGSLLAVGQAVLRVSEAPHLGCAKFVERFGAEAMRFVNSSAGRQLRLRGMNASVEVRGAVRPGDLAAKAPARVGAVADAGVAVWYNPRCSKCRGAEELLASYGVPARRVLYLDDPPPRSEITRVLGLLGTTDPRALMRVSEPRYAELGLDGATAGELIEAMTRYPELIQRPVVIWADRAVIARPPELLLPLLEAG
jgi:arsenate reductase (glutaredoxin)